MGFWNDTIRTQLMLARERSGMSRRELGKQLGVAGQWVSMVESGQREPNLNRLAQMADILGLRLDVRLIRVRKPSLK